MKKVLRTKKILEMVTEIKLIEYSLPFEKTGMEIKKALKMIVLLMMPLLVLSAVGILLHNGFVIQLGLYITMGSMATYSFIQGLKPFDFEKHLYENDWEEQYDKECEEQFDSFHRGMSKYYTKEMKEQIKNKKKLTNDEKKYYLALMKQNLNEANKPKLIAKNGNTIIDKDDLPFDKEESFNQISLETEAYLKTYNIPEYLVSSEEWEIFFESLYCYFEFLDIEDSFYECASKYNRFVLADAMVQEYESLTINDYIDNLDLFSDILGEKIFKNRDVRYLKKYIREYINSIDTNLINLNDVKSRKLK